MITMRKLALAILAHSIIYISGCQTKEPSSNTPIELVSIDSLFDAYHQFKLKINPIEGTNAGLEGYNDQLVNYLSAEVQADMIVDYNTFLEAIAAINLNTLSEADRMSIQVMQWDCMIKKEGLENPMASVASPVFDLPNINWLPINQIFSFHLYFTTFADVGGAQPFNTAEDYDNWYKRIQAFVLWLETAQTNMKEGMTQGVVLPKAIIKKVIGQMDQFTNPDVENHVFYAAVRNMPDSISAEERARIASNFQDLIANELIPAYQSLDTFLNQAYFKAGTETAGIGALPNGPATYQYLVKYHTSTNMTPDQIFELGKREVARIQSEMEKVKEEIGFEGDLKAFFDHVRTSKEQMPFTEPQQVIDNFNAIHERMKENLSKLFDLTPKSPFEVRRTQAFREASASAEYNAGSKDGSRPGIFYVPIPDVTKYNKYSDEALFLHEAIPGHHYQLSLQQENESLPGFLHTEGMGVYVEGWALYTESLGKELGLYTDPYQYFGMLSMEIHRAIRLVVDAGMHAKGWSREEAIQYSLENEAASETSIISEIERYMVAPGQALSYKIGQLKIRELRIRAEEAMGDQFDIKAFHNQVLGSGSLPLVVLEDKIDRWIEETIVK
ncbi:Uncharacterized conserved protein, DUF885 familyt [Reichenbachiella faecimaris]|uniref:Uncharacterized conserved protein, DUF885 familyt n=2 Tax=Reichenbachiella faecimaris TaxID=692418 RepID=A0A1W2GMS1_REIFA|nr:Uncharacterized conserved protein, DUF885 familyt [Reichenbachiella faecimaris]